MAGASKAARRTEFHAERASSIAATWDSRLTPWTTTLALSKRFAWFATDDQLVVIGTPVEAPRDIDLGLAYGIAYARDRELVLILPAGMEEPTRIRMPWIDRAIRLATYDSGGAVTELPPYAKTETLASYSDPIADSDHLLGDHETLIARLRQWADDCPELTAAHRGSYLAWHCEGRLVMRIQRVKGGVRVSAGVHATDPPPLEVSLTAAVQPDQFHTVVAAASTAIADRLRGDDGGHAEHRLQQQLAARAWDDLRLDRTLREFPAMRPVGNRGYIDLLGVDAKQRLHVVETKIGSDPMIVLQGLDYWLWVLAHLPALRAHLETLRRMPTSPKSQVFLDFVIAPAANDWLSAYTAAQLESLSGEIPWRLHRFDDWDTDRPLMTSFGSRTVPDGVPRAAPPGFVQRAETALIERAQ
jgi:hypothetical protein